VWGMVTCTRQRVNRREQRHMEGQVAPDAASRPYIGADFVVLASLALRVDRAKPQRGLCASNPRVICKIDQDVSARWATAKCL
jgi:hypothetical protein